MKIYQTIIASLFACALFASCDNYLDIQPKGEIIPVTVADYEAMLNEADVLKASATYPIYMTDDVFFPDKSESDYSQGMNTVSSSIKNLYTFQKEVFGESESDDMWVMSYNRLYYYNVIINNVMNATEATEAKKQAIKAEALVGRAFEYLNLANAYGKHYNAATAATDLAVPLVLSENIGQEGLSRATVQQVYDQILADLQEAAPYLPTKPTTNAFRASKAAGLGMLARMYLYMGSYQKALDYAKQSLAVSDTLIDLTQYKVVNPYGAIGRTNVPDLAKNPENIYIRLAPNAYGASGQVYGSDELMNTYSENDMRAKLYFSKIFFGIPLQYDMWMQWFRANLAMSTPEMYLIAAECEARIGSKDNAIALLNKLRNKRIENNEALTASTADEVLNVVLAERRREFPLLGLTRLIDLKRLNQEARFAKTVTHTVNGVAYTLSPNDSKYVLPIPAKVLRFNPEMPQNER